MNSTQPSGVLTIIDAMRIDFINDMMDYTFKAKSSGRACLYTVKVHPPTVTLPRIKSITSGTIPSFIDIALNFGSNQMKSDSFMRHMFLENRKVVFYGDNTWTQLFPHEFYRKNETKDSFFVNDFYEVIC